MAEKAGKLSVSKSKLIENALRVYLEHLDKAEYIQSFQQAASNKNLMAIAEDGMADYLNHLKE